MAKITFKKVNTDLIERMRSVFLKLSCDKKHGIIDSFAVKDLLNELYKSKFWWPTEDELEKYKKLYEKTPYQLRGNMPELKTPWCYESWIDAISSAEISLDRLEIDESGSGCIEITQYSWPSGGIEATEEIIKIFGGEVVDNDAV